MPQYPVDNYAVRIWSSRRTDDLTSNIAVAAVYLYENNTYRARIYFYPDGTPLSPPSVHSATGVIYLHFNLCQFDATIEILRTEKPLYVYFAPPRNGFLRSGKEPTGEDE